MKYIKLSASGLLLLAFSCKKLNKTGVSSSEEPAEYKKIKSERSYKASSGLNISNSYYNYSPAGLLTSVVAVDSTNNGSWTVKTSTRTIEYNAANKYLRESYVSPLFSSVTNYIYDAGGKIKFSINTVNDKSDTTEFFHNGDQTISKLKGALQYISYFKGGNLDSSVSVSNNIVSFRIIYKRGLKKDLSSARLNVNAPYQINTSEIANVTVKSGAGPVYSNYYTYTYDSEGYITKIQNTESGYVKSEKSFVYY